MVRNHQDGYPYLNLSLFSFVWKYPEPLTFLVTLIGEGGAGIDRNIWERKNILTVKILQKR